MNSKELLEQTGISRATLNNYIALGIVPRPEVLPPEPQDGAAPRIGYFPEGTAQRIAEIQRLKQEGWSMSRIAAHFGAAPPAGQTQPLAGARPTPLHESAALAAPRRDMPRLSIDEIAHPAYLVGTDFSVLWFNAASAGVLGAAAGGENVLKRLLRAPAAPARDEILRFHLAVARQHGAALDGLGDDLPAAQRAELERLGRDAQPPSPGFVSHVCGPGGTAEGVCLYAIRFREGILFAHVPRGPAADELESLLQARETVAGDLRRRRLPVLNDVAVVVMDLQHAPRIWSALPAEEYFELINQIWLAADPIVRRHRGTHGKHPRDGLACYFLRQRDGSYTWNALLAAHEMREAMRGLSKEWQLRKGWTTELCMDTGVDEGQQWVGTLQSGAAAGAEFTMYGETLARATAMSGLARGGAIWATKNVLAKLAPHERQRLKWGIHRRDRQGHDVFVPAVFSTIERVAAPDAMAEQWRDLAGLPITEIVDIAGAEGRRERAVDQQPI